MPARPVCLQGPTAGASWALAPPPMPGSPLLCQAAEHSWPSPGGTRTPVPWTRVGRPGAGVSALDQPVAGRWVRTCLRTVSQPSSLAHALCLPVELCTSPSPPAAGSGTNGQLGSMATSSSVPLAVMGGSTYSAISAGELHTCALRPDGTAYCWGAHRAWGMGCLRCLPSPAVASGGASAPLCAELHAEVPPAPLCAELHAEG